MSRQPSTRAALAVRAVKAGATTAVAVAAVVLTATATPAETRSSDSSVPQVEGAFLDTRCADAAGKTIVRTPRGETKAVSFERGWQVYRGQRPGTLVVVCPG